MSALLWSLVAVPAAAGALLLAAGRRAERVAAWLSVVVAAGGLAVACVVAVGRPAVSAGFMAGSSFGLAVDGLAALVLVAVAAVALLVLVFATAEIEDARSRFFGLMLLFVAAVLVTVTATTLVTLLFAWEIMGAASYALIAFWWRSDENVSSGTTAFLTTRLGDIGLYLAAGAALAGGTGLDLNRLAGLPSPWLHLAAGGVLVAALGKAAQLPFSFWLSRAMVGPSPVSALLHSAAMVAMGGYLLLRLSPLLAASGWADTLAAWVGVATAVVFGAVAVAQRDLKQLLAASTAAQLGYVVLAAGVGGVSGIAGGASQLVAHAATKALLFLAAGAWLTALGTKQLDALYGAGRRYRTVGVTFAVGALSLAGVPPLALWATKDEVLAAARERSLALYVAGLVGAVLSAAYAGRALGIVLRPAPGAARPGNDGATREAEPHDAEQPGTRHVGVLERIPLIVLSGGAAFLGVLALPPVVDTVRTLVAPVAPPGPDVSASGWEMALSGVLAVAAAGVAVVAAPRIAQPRWALGWLGLEAAAHAVVVRPVLRLAHALARFDDHGLDALVMRVPTGAVALARALATFDDRGVDRVVGAIARRARRLGALARRPQTGLVHQYYAQAAVGLGVALILLVVVT